VEIKGRWGSPQGLLENSTFQLDLRDKDFAPMLAWLRYRYFFNLDVILKGYNYCYSDGQTLLDAVNSFGTTDNCSLIEVLEGHDDAVTSVAYNYRSMQIASGSHDSTVRIWEADTGKLIRTLTGHEKAETSVVFSSIVSGNSEYKWVVSGSCDKTIRIWDAETGTLIRTLGTLGGHEEAVTSLAFSAERKWIVSGSDDKTARIWDAQTGQLLQILNHWEPVTSVAFSNDDMLVASGSHENTVRIWAAESGRLYHVLRDHTGPVTSVAFSSDCAQIASGSHDNTVRIWAVNTGKLLHTLEGHTKQVNSVVFSDDSMQLASGSDDETVRIWKTDTGELDYVLQGHTKPVTSVVFGHGRGHGQIFTASRDRTIQIWGQRPAWDKSIRTSFNMRIIIVFMSQPIIKIALEKKEASLEGTTADQRLELLDYDFLYDTAWKHITSFVETPIPRLD
jgi:WD40 repeat protein